MQTCAGTTVGTGGNQRGFTLVEVLVVIAIIALLAALVVPFTSLVARKRTVARVQVELHRLETAIEAYKAALGFYPPGNQASHLWTNRFAHFRTTLFYELTGCGTGANEQEYVDVLGRRIGSTVLRDATGVAAVMNSPAMGNQGRNFFGPLRPEQHALMTAGGFCEFAMPIPGVEPAYQQDQDGRWVTPWNYDPSSTNRINRDKFDLWIDVVITGKTNRICNWSDEPIIFQ